MMNGSEGGSALLRRVCRRDRRTRLDLGERRPPLRQQGRGRRERGLEGTVGLDFE